MQIVCPNCQAEYELDPPAPPFARDQDLVFRCTACGTAIPLRLNEPEIPDELEEEPDTDVVEAPPRVESFILLKQSDSTYRVENTAQLQRWIAERRIWPDDEVAIDGGDWQRIGDIDAYAVFFRLVEEAERSLSGATAPASVETTKVSATPPAKTKSSPGRTSLFARPARLDVASETPTRDSSVVGSRAKEEASPTPAKPTENEAAEVPKSDGSPSLNSEPTVEPAAAVVAEGEEVADEPEAVAQDVTPDVPERFGEVVPEEESQGFLPPDQPTMDMELEEDDFFSEEHSSSALSAGAGFDDDDDLGEWGQQRRKNMVMWWLMFFGALGGAAYLALDFLNARDAQVPVVPEASPADAELAPEVAVVTPPSTANDVQDDSGDATPSTADADEAEAEANTPEAVEAKAEEASSETKAAPTPKADESKPATPPPPKKPSASSEISRGWAQIDRENWTKAREHFSTALGLQPSNPDARFGMAYVNEQQGRMGEAVSQYCRLSATASGEVKVEAEGRLRALAKDCP